MINRIILMTVLYLSLISFFCTSGQAAAPPSKGTEVKAKTQEKVVRQESWEKDWQKTLAAAKLERTLNIYTQQGSEIRRAIGKAFKGKFGVDIEWTAGVDAELAPKLLRERGAGVYQADLFLSGSPTLHGVLKPAGVLEPIRPLLVLPEVLDEKAWYGGKVPFLDKEQAYVISPIIDVYGHAIINTTLVKPEEISSYNNLLESRWKGKIVFGDPTGGAGGAINLFTVLYMTMGPEFWRKFAENNPVIIRDARLATEWVARGKYFILLGVLQDSAVEFIKAGAPLKRVIPREGGYLTIGAVMAFIKQAPHPNAAKVFINWLLSREGSHVVSLTANRQAARGDVPIDHLSPDELRNPSVKYVIAGSEEFYLDRSRYIERSREIFSPLLK